MGPQDTIDEELRWLAFCYVAGELDAQSSADFEQRMAVDERACRALVEAVELGQAIEAVEARKVPAWSSNTQRSSVSLSAWTRSAVAASKLSATVSAATSSCATSSAATVVPPALRCPGRSSGVNDSASLIRGEYRVSALAAAIVLLAGVWVLSQSLVTAPQSPTATVARLWTDAAEDDLPAGVPVSDSVLTGLDETSENDSDEASGDQIPDWLFAAVNHQSQSHDESEQSLE